MTGTPRANLPPHHGDDDQSREPLPAAHFTLQQRARLLILRGRVLDAKLGHDHLSDDLFVA